MLQVFCINVAKVDRDAVKVDWDIAHVAMAIHVCFKCMFQIFHLFQTNVAGVLSGCCKKDLDVVYTCMLRAYVSSVFRYFIRMFASVSSRFCICLQCCSSVFASVLDACFKCFIYLLLYVATVAFRYFKSRSDVTHGMRSLAPCVAVSGR